jgi:hypothetical protein
LDSKMVIRYDDIKWFTPYITGPWKKGNSETLKWQFYYVGIKNCTSRIKHSILKARRVPSCPYRYLGILI